MNTRSLVLAALLRAAAAAAAFALFACAGPPVREVGTAADPAPSAAGMQVVPQALVGVRFVGLDDAKVAHLALGAALRKKAAIKEALEETFPEEGHRKWFFHAFDERNLYFFVARYHVRCEGMLGCLDYIVETVYRVPRTDRAARELEVQERIDLYEVGVRGVKGGMSEEEVIGVLGEPERKIHLQLFGSFRLLYPDLVVTFYGSEVLNVHEP